MASKGNLYYKQNRLKQLRSFCQTAHAGSFSKAAEQLNQSQPSVSLQIQALEREFHTLLFERRGPHISLTPEGVIMQTLAQPLVDQIDNLEQTFQAHCGSLETGNLNIAAGESTILYLLPTPINEFTNDYPKIDVKLHNVTGRDGLAMLRNDQVDFAVGSMLEVPDDIVYKPVVSYQTTLICPIGHPLAELPRVTLKDISPYGLILPPRHLSTWGMVDFVFSGEGLTYNVALEAGGWEVIKKYVELGTGISIVVDLCLSGNENLVKIPLDAHFPPRSYGIVLRRGRFLSAQAKRFIDIVESTCASS